MKTIVDLSGRWLGALVVLAALPARQLAALSLRVDEDEDGWAHDAFLDDWG